MTTLQITLLGATREVSAVQLPSIRPARSGRSLRHFALDLHVVRERHEELEAELRSAAAPDGKHLRGSDCAWRVRDGWTVVSHGQRPGIYVYRAEIQEVEDPERPPESLVDTEDSEPPVELRLEVLVVPVRDVDRAKAFYQAAGFRLDADYVGDEFYRVVHMTPPGSPCSILFGTGVTTAVPGTLRGLHLVVGDIERTCRQLNARGVETSEVFHDTSEVFRSCTGETRRSGPDPQRRRYRSYATFSDPDGNEWALQEVPA